MCCNGYSKSATANSDDAIHVNEHVVAIPLPDGYWLNAFPFSKDSKIFDLIGYGVGSEGIPSTIKLFQTTKNVDSDGWKLNEIQSLDFPVAVTYADLTGDGFTDLIICDRYGPNMTNLWDAESNVFSGLKILVTEVPNNTGKPILSETRVVCIGSLSSQEPGTGMDLDSSSPAAHTVWEGADAHLLAVYGLLIVEIMEDNPKTKTIHLGGIKGQAIRQCYMDMIYDTMNKDGNDNSSAVPQ